MILVVRASTSANDQGIVEPWDLLIGEGLQGRHAGGAANSTVARTARVSQFLLIQFRLRPVTSAVRCKATGRSVVTRLCGEGHEGCLRALLPLDRVSVRDPAAAFEDLGADVAAAFGPFVGQLGEHRADQSDDGVAVREDPDDFAMPADLLTHG